MQVNQHLGFPGCVLVAEDYVDAAVMLSHLLDGYGFRPVMAYRGDRAFELAEKYRPFAALIDLHLPAVSGYDLAKQIRSAPWGKDVLLIAVTASGEPHDQLAAEAAGFDRFMRKPILDPGALVFLMLKHMKKPASTPRPT